MYYTNDKFYEWLKLVKQFVEPEIYYSYSPNYIRVYYWQGKNKKTFAFVDKVNGNIIKNIYSSNIKIYGNINDNYKDKKHIIMILNDFI